MKLLSLNLENFKGCKNLEIDLGGDLAIFGDNGAGKTTVADAFYWLLFGKDSQNKAKFEIKPLGSDGKPTRGINSSVEGVFEIDGRRLELKRVYRETFEQKRGSSVKEFSGHTTDYFINSVPVQEKDYNARIAEISGEETFRLLTDPNFFCEALPWQKRREQLLSLIGNISDETVIESNEEFLKPLKKVIEDRSVSDHKTMVASKLKAVNASLEQIQPRIDEAVRAKPEVPAQAPHDMRSLRSQLDQLTAQKAEVSAGGAIASKNVDLRNIEADIQNRKTEIERERLAGGDGIRQAITEKSNLLTDKQVTLDRNKTTIRTNKSKVAEYEEARANLRTKYKEESEKVFVWEGTDTCASCGQSLPADEVESAKANALGNFNQKRAEELERIKTEGVKAKTDQDELELKIADQEKKVTTQENEASLLETEIAELRASLTEQPESKPKPDAKLDELEARKVAITAEIERLKQSDSTADIESLIEAVNAKIAQVNQWNAQVTQRDNQTKRVEELESERANLSKEFDRLQGELALCEEFIRARVRLLTDRINAKFETVSFKLFADQINGGLTECCEATVNGVPFASLNHGSRVNAGLEIIEVLGEKLGFYPPFFVDNSETVTRLRRTTAQQVRLVVSESDKSLRFERTHNNSNNHQPERANDQAQSPELEGALF